jgi:hypothetical protein
MKEKALYEKGKYENEMAKLLKKNITINEAIIKLDCNIAVLKEELLKHLEIDEDDFNRRVWIKATEIVSKVEDEIRKLRAKSIIIPNSKFDLKKVRA